MSKLKASTPDFREGFNHGFIGVVAPRPMFSFEGPNSEYRQGLKSGKAAYKKRELMELLTGDKSGPIRSTTRNPERLHRIRPRF